MKPKFVLNSFVGQLYLDGDNKIITPLIESNADLCIGYDANSGGKQFMNNIFKDKDKGDSNYWSLRHHDSIEKIQRMKDVKIYHEIQSIRDKPPINVKSKKMIEKKYKKVNVLKRMTLINNKLYAWKKEEENRVKQQNANATKNKKHKQYNSITSKYLTHQQGQYDNNIREISQSDIIAHKNNGNNKVKNEDTSERKKDLNKLISFMNGLI